MNISLAAASRADDGREKAELIALVKQLTPKEVDRVIERMQAPGAGCCPPPLMRP